MQAGPAQVDVHRKSTLSHRHGTRSSREMTRGEDEACELLQGVLALRQQATPGYLMALIHNKVPIAAPYCACSNLLVKRHTKRCQILKPEERLPYGLGISPNRSQYLIVAELVKLAICYCLRTTGSSTSNCTSDTQMWKLFRTKRDSL